MHFMYGGTMLVDMALRYLHARTAARLVFGPSSAWFLAAAARMSLASSSGDLLVPYSLGVRRGRCRWLALLWCVAGCWELLALDVPAIHRRNTCLTEVWFPGRGRSVPRSARYAPCTILTAGIHMWDRACDQLRRHIERLQGTGGSVRESIGAERLVLSWLLGGGLFSATLDRTLVPISVDIVLASTDWSDGHGIGWRLLEEGKVHEGVEFKDHLLICARFSCSGLALKLGHSHVVSPLRRPWMPYAIVATTWAMPMSPIMSSGETNTVRDFARVSPTVMRPRQSSVSSVGEPLE